MSISTVDGALAGMQPPRDIIKAATPTMTAGRPQSLFYLDGIPGPGSAPAPGIGGEVLTSLTGQIPFDNPASGNTYLARLQASATTAGTLLLCDRLWQNSGLDVTSTAEQTFTGAADIPARDMNGNANGHGVLAALEASAAGASVTLTTTLKYTNQDGTADKTGTNIIITTGTRVIGSFFPIGLAAGDKGIRKAQSLTLSASWSTGTVHVVLYRVLARLELIVAMTPNAIDALTCGFSRIYNNTVPFLVFIPSVTTATVIHGHVIWTQG